MGTRHRDFGTLNGASQGDAEDRTSDLHAPGFIDSTDPASTYGTSDSTKPPGVQAGHLWIEESSADNPSDLKYRNAANGAWVDLTHGLPSGNLDLPGTLDVTGAGTFDSTLTSVGAATLDTGANGSSFGGALYINESANANMTTGLTINQGAADDQAFALKSSDVETGLTTAPFTVDVETDDFFTVSKASATLGGVILRGLAEDDSLASPFRIQVHGGTASDTKTTSGAGLVDYIVTEHDGANSLANITADGNVFTIRARVGGSIVTRLLVDEDGDLYSVTAAQTFDDHDDLALLNRYDIVRRDDLRQQHAEWATEWEDELISLGVLGAPVAEGGMTNVTQLQRLMVGALRQTSDRLTTLESENAQLRSQVQGLLN